MSTNNKYMTGNNFNVHLFNADFKKVQAEALAESEQLEQKKLNEINDYYIKKDQKKNIKSDDPINMTISEILIKWLDTIEEIIIEISRLNYSITGFINIFTKKDRLFYIGITLIVFGMIGYLINKYLLDDDNINEKNVNISLYIKDQKNSKLIDDSIVKLKSFDNGISNNVVMDKLQVSKINDL